MYPFYTDFYDKLLPAGRPLIDRIQAFLGGKKATLESLKDPYGISDMSDPVLPSFVEQRESAPTPQRFDNTPEGQYQRYFKTSEFDNVFGAGARGEGAPKDAAAMQSLGSKLQAPSKETNIASMYAAQSAMGRVNQDAIQDYFADADLPGNEKLKDGGTALQAWAKANPMLAQRLYEKNRPRIEDKPATDTGTAVRGETPGTLEQQIEYGAGSPFSKSPTEFDISPATEEEFEKEFLKTQLGKYF